MKIGEIIPAERDITLNEGKKTVTIIIWILHPVLLFVLSQVKKKRYS